jgi:two-component system NtrC family sensor kinase
LGRIDMKLSLKTKIVALSVAILLLGLGLNTLITSRMISEQYLQALRGESRVSVRHLRLQMERILQFGIALKDISGFGKQCREAVRDNPNMSFAMVVDAQGKVLFHNDTWMEGRYFETPEFVQALSQGESSVVRVQTPAGDHHVVFSPLGNDMANGAVAVGFPAAMIDRKVRSMVAWQLLVGFVVTILAAGALVVGLSFLVSRPLNRLLTTIREIAGGRDLGKRVEVSSGDELGRLAEDFNRMTQHLQQAHSDLELRVQQRTAELVQTNKELEESKTRFSDVVQHGGEWIWETDPDRIVTYTSPICEDVLGYKPEELIGRKLDTLFDPRTREERCKQVEGGMRQRVVLRRQLNVLVHKDGRLRSLEISAGPMFDRDGVYLGYRGTAADITQALQAQEALKESREFLNRIINAIPDPVFVADEQHKFILVNDAMCAMTKRPRQEVLNKTVRDFMSEEDSNLIWRQDEEVLQNGADTCNEETIAGSEDRKGITVLSKKSLYVDPQGKKYIVGVLRDITELQSAQIALAQANEHLEQRVAERTAELKSALSQVSQAQSELVQAEKMGMLGQLVAGVAHEINTPTGAIMNVMQDSLNRLSVLAVSAMKLASSPQSVTQWLSQTSVAAINNAQPPSDDDAKIHRELERNLRKRGVEDYQKVAEVVYTAGLNADDPDVLERLREGDVLDFLSSLMSLKTAHQICAASVQKIARIVKALRYYSRTGQGELFDIDINESIDNTLVILQNRIKHVARLEKQYQQPLPTLRCEPNISQVWTNVLCNACDAIEETGRSEKGLLRISTSATSDSIVVNMFNDGPPINPEFMRKMFDPFVTSKPIGKGTGLGLSTCHAIVSSYSGKIEARNEAGGVSITVTLPLHNPDEHKRCPAAAVSAN